MKKDKLVEEVCNLYGLSQFNEFAQWAEEKFLEMIPYLPVEKFKVILLINRQYHKGCL